jgi:Beta xylosidase C-terminal Concanavalin A-like domain
VNVKSVLLRITLNDNGASRFSYSKDGKTFEVLGDEFVARQGVWIGAKVGLFSLANVAASTRGYAEYDWFRFQ